jgi:hypothetical protein
VLDRTAGGGCHHADAGTIGQHLADALNLVVLGDAQGQKFEAVAQSVAISHQGAKPDGEWRQGLCQFHGDDFARLQLAGQGGPDAVFSQFARSSPKR